MRAPRRRGADGAPAAPVGEARRCGRAPRRGLRAPRRRAPVHDGRLHLLLRIRGKPLPRSRGPRRRLVVAPVGERRGIRLRRRAGRQKEGPPRPYGGGAPRALRAARHGSARGRLEPRRPRRRAVLPRSGAPRPRRRRPATQKRAHPLLHRRDHEHGARGRPGRRRGREVLVAQRLDAGAAAGPRAPYRPGRPARHVGRHRKKRAARPPLEGARRRPWPARRHRCAQRARAPPQEDRRARDRPSR